MKYYVLYTAKDWDREYFITNQKLGELRGSVEEKEAIKLNLSLAKLIKKSLRESCMVHIKREYYIVNIKIVK